MVKSAAFEKYTLEYEQWFEKNRMVYEAELRAVRALIPQGRSGMEIGVGTGRFAVPLGIKVGVEPSRSMRSLALKQGIKALGGAAENLPFKDSTFTHVLMVTTICFLDDVNKAFCEAHRVLSEGGCLIIGFVDSSSPVGQEYLKNKNSSVFYREATFYSADEVIAIMKKTGFHDFESRQTIFSDLPEITGKEVVKTGYGQGSFIVIRGKKKEQVDR
ncbi:MAG: class I SAM-dependent methyltransferase [Deltaproteobacteria bacterium]|nr:class I SAM-dependent methyltransferase [Deltaproteobacteria bacterium]